MIEWRLESAGAAALPRAAVRSLLGVTVSLTAGIDPI